MTSATADHPSLAAIKSTFGDVPITVAEFRAQTTVIVPADKCHEILRFLRDDPRCDYNVLIDLGGVDYLGYPVAQPARFSVVYHLLSHRFNLRIRVKVYLDPSVETSGIAVDPALSLDTVTDLWPGAEWAEREVYDMFGIRFQDHPDLRRILMWKDFPAHPLRKDYPLRGRGEREHYQSISRAANH